MDILNKIKHAIGMTFGWHSTHLEQSQVISR